MDTDPGPIGPKNIGIRPIRIHEAQKHTDPKDKKHTDPTAQKHTDPEKWKNLVTEPGMTVPKMITKRLDAWPSVSTSRGEAFEVGGSVVYRF